MSRSSSRGRGAATAPSAPPADPVEQLATMLDQPQAVVLTLPESLIDEAMRAAGFSLADRAKVFARAAAARAVGGETVLARHFEKAELRQREPWRAQADNFEAERAAICAAAPAAQKRLLLELAKTHTMSPEDIVTSLYVLLGDDEARRFYGATLLTKQGLERIRSHNFYVASLVANPEVFLA